MKVKMTTTYTRVIDATHYWILGNAHHFCGNWVKALWYCEKHMVIAKDLDDREALCMAYGNVGMVSNKLGEYRKAVEYIQQAMELAKQIELLRVRTFLKVYMELGSYFLFLQEQIKDIIIEMSEQARAYGNLAVSYEKQGDFVQSIEFNEQYLELCRHEGDLDSLNRAYNSLGTCYLHLHEYEKALTLNTNKRMHVYLTCVQFDWKSRW